MQDSDIKLNNNQKNKKMKKIIIVLFSILSLNSWAQKQTAEIVTSAQCEMCKERILEEMQFTKGVTAVNLDVESQLLTITFKSKKTNLDKIKRAISLIGYDADKRRFLLLAMMQMRYWQMKKRITNYQNAVRILILVSPKKNKCLHLK